MKKKISLKLKLPQKNSSSKLSKLAPQSTKHSSFKVNQSNPTPKSIKSSKFNLHPLKNPVLAIPLLPLNKIVPSTYSKPQTSTRVRSYRQPIDPNSSNLFSSENQSNFSNLRPLTARNSNTEKIPTKDLLFKHSLSSKDDQKTIWENEKLPLTAGQVINHFKQNLTNFEQGEILGYRRIYCIGVGANKYRGKEQINYGFDDEKGDYKVVVGDHIAYRYEVLSELGRGSFGLVLKVKDHKSKKLSALKIIKNKSRFNSQAGIEVKILEFLKEKDPEDTYNTVRLNKSFIFRKHNCITFELLSINLYEFLERNHFKGLSMSLIRRFSTEILRSLSLQERLGIIHCDLKPENILLKEANRSVVKVIDYGSACFLTEKMYTYIESRFYRAPEIMLGIPYSNSIDMWSFGCILVELFTGTPIFPGESENEQMACIMEVLGSPPLEILEESSRKKLFFDSDNKPRVVVNSRGRKRIPNRKNLKEILFGADLSFYELVCECFEWDPRERITAEEALRHEWILEGLTPALEKRNSRTGSLQPHEGGVNFGDTKFFHDVFNPHVTSRRIKIPL